MTEKCLEQLDRDESVNVEEILGGNVATVSGHIVGCEEIVGLEIGQGTTRSVCPSLTPSANLEGSVCEASFHERDEVDRILREELSGSRVTSTPLKGLWPIYSKSCVTEVSGGVEESDFTNGGFSTLQAFAKKRADD